MALTREEIETRATARAAEERLHTWRISPTAYLVKSRRLAPGTHHVVTVDDRGAITGCTSCPGWYHRKSCVHAAAVTRRLEREGKVRRPAATEVEAVITSTSRRSQLYRAEA